MTEHYIISNGAKLWAYSSGQGIPVMLCNGGPGCSDYLGPVAATVDDLAHVIRFEQRGCGRSDALAPYDVTTSVKDLENIRHYFELNRWIIGGHSWGADLALAYALQHPDSVLGIVCISGGRMNNDREWHKAYRQRIDTVGEQLPHFDYPPNMEVNERVNASWRQFIKQPDLLRALSQMDIPALFVYGDQDIRPSWPVEQLANLMPGARYVSILGAAHYIWFTQPEELKTHLREFISAVFL